MCTYIAFCVVALLPLYVAYGSPIVAKVLTIPDRTEKGFHSQLNLYAPDSDGKIKWKTYPDSYFKSIGIQGFGPDYTYWANDKILAFVWSSDPFGRDTIRFFGVEDNLDLKYIGSISADSVFFGRGGWTQFPAFRVAFVNENVYVFGRAWFAAAANSSLNCEVVLQAHVGPKKTIVIDAVHTSLDPNPVLPVTPIGNAFVGSDSGLWEVLDLYAFNFSKAAPVIVRTDKQLTVISEPDRYSKRTTLGNVEILNKSFRYAGGYFFIGGGDPGGGIYDPKTDRLYQKAHDLWIPSSTVMTLGNILLSSSNLESGRVYIETYDIANISKIVSLAKHTQPEFEYVRVPLLPFGNELASIDDYGYVTKFRLSPRGVLSYVHSPAELMDAIDRGDLTKIRNLADWQVNPIMPQFQLNPIVHAINTKAYSALEILVNVEKSHNGEFHSSDSHGEPNPLNDAIILNDEKSVRLLGTELPGLVSRDDHHGVVPFFTAVESGSIAMAKKLIDLGADPKQQTFSFRGKRAGVLNALSFAQTSEMKDFLRNIGVDGQIILEKPRKATAQEDRNRIRSKPSLDGDVLGFTSKNETVSLIAVGAEFITIDGRTGRWYKITTSNGVTGWSFGAFYNVSGWNDL